MTFRNMLLAAAAVVISACATTPSTRPAASAAAASPEQAVEQRAAARWDAILAKEFGNAYQFLTPGFREVNDRQAYVRRMMGSQVKWSKARVDEVACQDRDTCQATVQITYSVRVPGQGIGDISATTPVFEKWLRVDGQWYHLPDKLK